MHVVFTGRAQGVGFRCTVYRLAEGFAVQGFVRNALDGTVELVAEGTEQELIKFLHSIRESWPGHNIVHELLAWEQATGEYDKFRISY
jgi:acylphosphatase